MSLSGEEIERYARHLVLRDIGGPGQQRLKKRACWLSVPAGLAHPSCNIWRPPALA